MTRNPTDKCLLCGKMSATQRNSHIIPKFISSDFLGDKSNKKGYIIDSEAGVKKTIQDSPKEDYILCPNCETYFSVIETEVSQEIKSLHSDIEDSITEPLILENAKIPSKIFHLFYFSQFWRVSVSNLDIFKWLNLPKEIENHLRNELNKFSALNKVDFQEKLSKNELGKIIPYGVFTSLDFSERTKNLIITSDVSDPYCLIADKFGLALYSGINQIPEKNREFYNTDVEHKKVSILPSQLWEEIVNKPMKILATKQTNFQEIQRKLKLLADQLSKLSNKEAGELREILASNYRITQ